MRRLFAGLLLATPLSVFGQSFATRADAGDLALATQDGQVFLEAMAPLVGRAIFGCVQGQERLEPGVTVTLVASIARDGTPSNVEVQPGNTASRCIERRLVASKLPEPTGWDWARGNLPITFRMAVLPGNGNGGGQ